LYFGSGGDATDNGHGYSGATTVLEEASGNYLGFDV
jgi:hypothetical protein